MNTSKNHIYYLLLIVSLLSTVATAQWVPVDLGEWQQEGVLSNGNWNISADSLSVNQTINGAPTFFVAPDTLINTTVRGQLQVGGSDNDFIGFVVTNAPSVKKNFSIVTCLIGKREPRVFLPGQRRKGSRSPGSRGPSPATWPAVAIPFGHMKTASSRLSTRSMARMKVGFEMCHMSLNYCMPKTESKLTSIA